MRTGKRLHGKGEAAEAALLPYRQICWTVGKYLPVCHMNEHVERYAGLCP